ncbi:MAG: PilN domain-containing protein [Planctomycetota bacterium]|nr:MAG: PilN domain-containing protein [Planctomycetota bacterium]
MTVEVNLLPSSYLNSRHHHRRFQVGLVVGTIFLVILLMVGLIFHVRANKTRVLFAETEDAREATETLKKNLVKPTAEAALLSQQIALATQLRSKHNWSRLLSMFSKVAPDKIVLTTMNTNPTRWSPALQKLANKNQNTKNKQKLTALKFVEGITIRGYAAGHQDLSKFIAAINNVRMFSLVDLKDMKRDLYLSQEAILFEIQCYW